MSSGRSNLNHAATLLGSKLTVTTQKMDLGIILDSAIEISDLSARVVKKQTNCQNLKGASGKVIEKV